MKTFSAAFLFLFAVAFLPALQADRPTLYPFDVKVGGQLAEVRGDPQTTLFASIKDPVSAEAELVIPGYGDGMVIINLFQIDERGAPVPGFQALIYTIPSGGKTRLHQTIDQRRPEPGLYGANIVYNGQTSRVKFTVKPE